MNDDVYEALCEARELAQTNHVIEYNGKATHSVKKSFSRLCKDCGIKASAHALRHTAATWMVIDGVPLSEVARVLGDSEKTVETVYGNTRQITFAKQLNLSILTRPKVHYYSCNNFSGQTHNSIQLSH